MAWSGSAGSKTFARLTGLFTGSTAWAQSEAASRGIVSTDHDTHDQDLSDGINSCLMNDGGNKFKANIDAGGYQLTNLGAPTTGGAAANKTYVDGAVTATTNATVRIASTATVTKASAMDNGKTLDSVVLATGDRVLLKNQTSASENGVWVVAASGAPARASDFDTFAEHVGSIVNVTAGTVNTGLSFRCTVNAGGTLDSTSITYVQFGSALATPVSVANGGTGQGTAADAFSAIKQDATSVATGVSELCTVSEYRIGTDTTRTIPVNVPWDAQAEVAISFTSTVTPDFTTGNNFGTTATSSFTLANPSTPKVGQSGWIRITQDGTGSRAISSWGTSYVAINGQKPVLTTTASAIDYLNYIVRTATRIEVWLSRAVS